MSNVRPSNELFLLQAGSLLRRGHLVAFPTETVYGLGVNASNDKAVASVFELKNRPEFNPLTLHIADAKEAELYAEVNEKAQMLIRRFWPGSLTVVLKKKEKAPISDLISAGTDTIALRVPSHPIAHALLRSAACPVAATSANKSGSMSPTTADHVEESFGSKIDMILDGGQCTVGIESTVVDMTGEQPVLLRAGGLTVEEIESVVGPLAESSGRKDRQYAPKLPLRINADSAKGGEALLGFGHVPNAAVNLSETEDLTEAAANLFYMLRKLDKGDYIGIAVSPIPDEGLGKAINDRLKSAVMKAKKEKPEAKEKKETKTEDKKIEPSEDKKTLEKAPEKKKAVSEKTEEKTEKKKAPVTQFGKNSAPAKK